MKTVFIGMSLEKHSTTEYFEAIYKEFINEGYQVVIFTDGQRSGLVNKNANPIILTWPSRRPTGLKDMLFFASKIRLYKPSVVISNFGSVNVMTMMSFLLSVPKRIVWVHTLSTQLGQYSKFSKIRKNLIYLMATNLIANSNAMKKDIQNTNRFVDSKVKVIPNALEIKEVENVQRDENLVVFAGRLHRIKGVDILIRAFKLVHEKVPSLKLKIVGPGEEVKMLSSLVTELNLSEVISFEGPTGKEGVLKYFKSANFVVVPSRSEAFGYVVIEAMSLGTPVIGSDVDGILEIITHEKNGLLFKEGNAKDLSEKILDMKNLLLDSDEMRINAYELVNEKYNVNKIAKDFVEYISV